MLLTAWVSDLSLTGEGAEVLMSRDARGLIGEVDIIGEGGGV